MVEPNYMKDVKLAYPDCCIYYIGTDVQLDLFENAHIRQACQYMLNQKNLKLTLGKLAKARKRIKTLFSQLTDQFMTIRNIQK